MKYNSKKIFPAAVIVLSLLTTGASCQIDSLRIRIATIAKSINGHVGVAMLHLDKKDTLTFNGKDRFPMQSVYKFPLALAVLHQVDAGKLKLQQKVHLDTTNLLPNTWSPLREKYHDGKVDVPLSEIIAATVSQSDNNGCDILFGMLNGPKEVEKYIHSLGVKDMAIVATEEEMHKSWTVQYQNWCKPTAMTQLFNVFYTGNILLKPSKDFLWKVLVETTTGSKRIKGQLAPHIIVGHKTGTGGKNESGISSAFNDAGIIIMPNNEAIALSVFVSDTPEPEASIQAVIAKIAKAVYDHYK